MATIPGPTINSLGERTTTRKRVTVQQDVEKKMLDNQKKKKEKAFEKFRNTQRAKKINEKRLFALKFNNDIDNAETENQNSLLSLRTNTGLETLEYNQAENKSKRTHHEVISATEQCNMIIGNFKPGTLCWLCGFPIKTLVGLPNILLQPHLDNNACEHVLPIRLANIITGLAVESGVGNKYLLHTEYEYAHHFCNYVKSDTYFLTCPKEGIEDVTDENADMIRDFCNIQVNHEKIIQYLILLYGNIRAPNDFFSTHHSIIYSRNDPSITFPMTSTNKRTYFQNNQIVPKFSNLVQYFISQNPTRIKDMWGNVIGGTNNINIDGQSIQLSSYVHWIISQYWKIIFKMIGTINYIKIFDGCYSNDPTEKGILYKQALNIIKSLKQKDFSRQANEHLTYTPTEMAQRTSSYNFLQNGNQGNNIQPTINKNEFNAIFKIVKNNIPQLPYNYIISSIKDLDNSVQTIELDDVNNESQLNQTNDDNVEENIDINAVSLNSNNDQIEIALKATYNSKVITNYVNIITEKLLIAYDDIEPLLHKNNVSNINSSESNSSSYDNSNMSSDPYSNNTSLSSSSSNSTITPDPISNNSYLSSSNASPIRFPTNFGNFGKFGGNRRRRTYRKRNKHRSTRKH